VVVHALPEARHELVRLGEPLVEVGPEDRLRPVHCDEPPREDDALTGEPARAAEVVDLVAGDRRIAGEPRARRREQLQKQVGGVQPEAVPAARAPRLPDAALLEDHVLAAVPAQVVAGGEAGLPSADDHRVDRVGHRDRG
jgi:hypothetical protein